MYATRCWWSTATRCTRSRESESESTGFGGGPPGPRISGAFFSRGDLPLPFQCTADAGEDRSLFILAPPFPLPFPVGAVESAHTGNQDRRSAAMTTRKARLVRIIGGKKL